MHQSAIAMQICQESRGPVTAQTSDAVRRARRPGQASRSQKPTLLLPCCLPRPTRSVPGLPPAMADSGKRGDPRRRTPRVEDGQAFGLWTSVPRGRAGARRPRACPRSHLPRVGGPTFFPSAVFLPASISFRAASRLSSPAVSLAAVMEGAPGCPHRPCTTGRGDAIPRSGPSPRPGQSLARKPLGKVPGRLLFRVSCPAGQTISNVLAPEIAVIDQRISLRVERRLPVLIDQLFPRVVLELVTTPHAVEGITSTEGVHNVEGVVLAFLFGYETSGRFDSSESAPGLESQ